MSSFWRPFDEEDEHPVTQGRHWSVTTLKHLLGLLLLTCLSNFIYVPPEPKQDKRKKRRSRKRQRTSEEAHNAHTEMCGKAVKMMSKIERILDKFDSDSSDVD